MSKRRYSRRLPALAFSIALASNIAPAYAQFDRGPTETKPWAELKLNPKTRVRLQFRNASIDAILSLFERVSGITLVKDPTLTGTLTLTSATAVPLNDAFNILSKTLSLKGYRIQREDGLLVIRKQAANNGNRTPQAGGLTPGGMSGGPGGGPGEAPEEASVLRVYTIQYANASQLARTLNEVFGNLANGNGGANPQPAGPGGGPTFRGPGGGPGGGGPGGDGPGGGGGPVNVPPPGGGGGGGTTPEAGRPQAFAQGGGPAGRTGGTASFRASADDYSNSIAIYATERVHTQVKEMIAKLDRLTEDPKRLKVYRLVHAGAADLVAVVQNVLNGAAPTGRGGATTQQTSGPTAFMRAASGGTAGAGQVVEDSRTNSLVVTATETNLATLDRIIPELDKPVESQGTAFIFPLKNAKSDDIASLLQQAFGQRQGTGTTSTPGQNTTSSNSSNRNQTPTNRSGGLGGNGLNELPLQLNERGELLTSIGVNQVIGPTFFGGSSQQSTGSQSRTNQSVVRDSQGRVVNTPELAGQVTVVSDPNTNSLIVVAMPEHAELIRQILDQLDKIPEQVMIEAIIVEAALDSSRKFGVEWKFAADRLFKSNTSGTGQTDFGQTAATTGVSGLQYTVTGPNLNVFFNALKEDTSFHVLSTPRIFTSNNVQAEINISQSVPYVLSSSTDTNGNISYNYSFEDVGIVLTVTPRITSNGYVTMEVSQTANELQGYTSFNAPIINQRQADTTVSVRDGDAIILGGIMRKTVTSSVKKVPLLGDLPLLGNLFKSTSRADSKTELMVFLRPRIVRSAEDAQKLREEAEKISPSSARPRDGGKQKAPSSSAPR